MVDNRVVRKKFDTIGLNRSEPVHILKDSQIGYKCEYLRRGFVYAITLNDLMLNCKSALVI
jgi:hypothetical protein